MTYLIGINDNLTSWYSRHFICQTLKQIHQSKLTEICGIILIENYSELKTVAYNFMKTLTIEINRVLMKLLVFRFSIIQPYMSKLYSITYIS